MSEAVYRNNFENLHIHFQLYIGCHLPNNSAMVTYEELKEEKKGKKLKGEERNRGIEVIPYSHGLAGKVSRVFKKRKVSIAVRSH